MSCLAGWLVGSVAGRSGQVNCKGRAARQRPFLSNGALSLVATTTQARASKSARHEILAEYALNVGCRVEVILLSACTKTILGRAADTPCVVLHGEQTVEAA
jgi:hypothetical protein